MLNRRWESERLMALLRANCTCCYTPSLAALRTTSSCFYVPPCAPEHLAQRALALAITLEVEPSALRSSRNLFRGEQCTRGALLAPTAAGGKRRVVADIAKLTV